MNLDFPFDFDHRGRTATTTEDDHIRDLIEQVLFTSPGERVNRPDFGCGLMRLVFEAASEELATTLQFTTQASLQRWLGDTIQVEELLVEVRDAALLVTVRYVVRRTGERRVADFRREGAAG